MAVACVSAVSGARAAVLGVMRTAAPSRSTVAVTAASSQPRCGGVAGYCTATPSVAQQSRSVRFLSLTRGHACAFSSSSTTSAPRAAPSASRANSLARKFRGGGGGGYRGTNPRAARVVTEASSFADLGLDPDLVAATDALLLTEPTDIQSAAIPRILSGGHYMVASHTGSGKTLTYLLPVIQALRRAEAGPYTSPLFGCTLSIFCGMSWVVFSVTKLHKTGISG